MFVCTLNAVTIGRRRSHSGGSRSLKGSDDSRKVKLRHLFLADLVLIVCLVIYTIVGSLLFQAIQVEPSLADDNRRNESTAQPSLKGDILEFLVAIQCNDTSSKALYELESRLDALILKHEMAMMTTVADGRTKQGWSFTQAMWYCITVYTTIGYGNLVTTSSLGRLVTVVYSLIGTPLLMLCLAKMGDLLKHLLSRLWLGALRNATKCWNSTSSEGKSGSIRRSSPIRYRQGSNMRTETGSDYQDNTVSDAPSFAHMSDGDGHSAQCEVDQDCETTKSTCDVSESSSVESGAILDRAEMEPPFALAVSVFIAYMLLGSFVFTFWLEPEWGYSESLYYIYVTLSTIGFGDMVPDLIDSNRLPLFLIYLFVGLCLASMCFNIMITKFRKKASKTRRVLQQTVGTGRCFACNAPTPVGTSHSMSVDST